MTRVAIAIALLLAACGPKSTGQSTPIGNQPDREQPPPPDGNDAPPPPHGAGDDRDGDGAADSVDMCPDDPEDFDGFQDDDGCPDPDNDMDGILDVDDQCPNEPETMNGQTDTDGCPP